MKQGIVLFSFPCGRSEQDNSLRTARTHSMSSYAGYHTPIEDEIAAGSMIIEGEGVSDIPSDNGALTVGRGSYHTQVTWKHIVCRLWKIAVPDCTVLGTFSKFCTDDGVTGRVPRSAEDVV